MRPASMPPPCPVGADPELWATGIDTRPMLGEQWVTIWLRENDIVARQLADGLRGYCDPAMIAALPCGRAY